jgi:hypothetical protein
MEPFYRVMEIRLCSSLLKVSKYMHCIPTTITSALFIGFGHMSNGWKSEEINYDFVLEVS